MTTILLQKMRLVLLLFVAVLVVSCSGRVPKENYLFHEETPNEDLLQTIKNSYLKSAYDVSDYSGYKVFRHREEIAATLKIADTFHIASYDEVLVLYSYSIGPDIITESGNYRWEDGKWYRTSFYASVYDDDPFRDGNPERALEILTKEKEWKEGSLEERKRILGSHF